MRCKVKYITGGGICIVTTFILILSRPAPPIKCPNTSQPDLSGLTFVQKIYNSSFLTNSPNSSIFPGITSVPKVRSVSCLRLFEGSNDEYYKARSHMSYKPKPLIGDEQFLQELQKQGCEKIKKRHYILQPLSEEEKNFPIVFSILLYKNVQQMERLLRAIYRPQNFYCIHVDADSSQFVLDAVRFLAGCFQNVFVASKLESIVYASYSRLQAEINCMKDALLLNSAWKYYINLASEVFPLKTNAEIVKILTLYNGANGIEGKIGHKNSFWHDRYLRKWKTISLLGKKPLLYNTKMTHSPPPHNLIILKGSAYGAFSRDFVDYIINNKQAHDLLEWSRDTYSPDEHFWPTLNNLKVNKHLNTPGGYSGKPDDKPWLQMHVSWCPRDYCGSGYVVHFICIFGIKDLPHLASAKEMFANKFHNDFEYLTLDCLEELLYYKVVQGNHLPLHRS